MTIERKCGTCKYFEPAPLWRKGWCRHPLLYAPHQSHLVSEDDLDCDRGMTNYWEPAEQPVRERPEEATHEYRVIQVGDSRGDEGRSGWTGRERERGTTMSFSVMSHPSAILKPKNQRYRPLRIGHPRVLPSELNTPTPITRTSDIGRTTCV